MCDLTHAQLLQWLAYDKDTGLFTWLSKPAPKVNVHIGAVAGGLSGRGYIDVGINGRRYKAHRLAWFYVTGEWPAAHIDHRDGVRANNRWANLRLCTSQGMNAQNLRRAHRDSATKVLGVYRHGNGFRARIWASGRDHCLGTFETETLAQAAYLDAKRVLHAGNTL